MSEGYTPLTSRQTLLSPLKVKCMTQSSTPSIKLKLSSPSQTIPLKRGIDTAPVGLDTDFHFIGDVHLGKVFKSGVRPEYAGYREKMIREQFVSELEEAFLSGKSAVQVGDLFDNFRVPVEMVVDTAQVLTNAAAKMKMKGKGIYILAGNHDESRDADRVSSLALLQMLVAHHPNVKIIRGKAQVHESILFVPFNAFSTPEEQLSPFVGQTFKAVVGHWDVTEIAGAHQSQLLPFDIAQEMAPLIVTGHDHNPRCLWWEQGDAGVSVFVVGSMQPYSHAEDPEELFYTTMTLDDLAKRPTGCRGKHLRVLLKRGEEFNPPPGLDPIAITFKYEGVEEEQKEIDVENLFDIEALIETAFSGLSDYKKAVLRDLLEKAKADA